MLHDMSLHGNFFLQTGNEGVAGAKLLLDVVTKHLEGEWEELKVDCANLGTGLQSVVRPWALMFIKSENEFLKEALLEKAVQIHRGLSDSEPEQRVWLDSIQVCRVDSTHQLRGVLSAIHVNNSTSDKCSNIIDWMIQEKDNQPPCLIVVVDLVDLMISEAVNYSYSNPHRYLHLPVVDLSLLLINLVETCDYLSTTAKENWERSLRLQLSQKTSLFVTDAGCLPPQQVISDFGEFQSNHTKKIYQILNYYLHHLA